MATTRARINKIYSNQNMGAINDEAIMLKKDLINEYIGIIAVIVIILAGVFGVYYYMNHQPQSTIKDITNAIISVNNK
jgi:hypothetical protein